MAPIRSGTRQTCASSAGPSILEITSSTPEAGVILAPQSAPSVPRPQPTPNRVTRNATASSLASPPPSPRPRAPALEPSNSQTNGAPKPRSKPRPKARPIVTKTVDVLVKIIELSDSSDAEIQEVRTVAEVKGKGKARAVVVDDDEVEEVNGVKPKKLDKGKGRLF